MSIRVYQLIGDVEVNKLNFEQVYNKYEDVMSSTLSYLNSVIVVEHHKDTCERYYKLELLEDLYRYLVRREYENNGVDGYFKIAKDISLYDIDAFNLKPERVSWQLLLNANNRIRLSIASQDVVDRLVNSVNKYDDKVITDLLLSCHHVSNLKFAKVFLANNREYNRVTMDTIIDRAFTHNFVELAEDGYIDGLDISYADALIEGVDVSEAIDLICDGEFKEYLKNRR